MSSATSAASAVVHAVVHPGEGRSYRAFGNEILFKLTAEQTGGALSLGLATVPAGSEGPPLHVHERDDEIFLILEGRYRVCVDGAWSEAGPGAVVFLPRGIPHTFQVGAEGGRHWVVTTPGGFDRFYAAVAELLAAPGAPDRARLAAVNAEYGARIVAPAGAPA